MDQLTLLLEEPPASPSPSPESERDWMTRVATWRSSSYDLLAELLPPGSSGRTSLACSVPTEAGILEPSSGRWGTQGMGSPTEFWTVNGSEFHSGAVASSLSDILEAGELPQRYFLSPRACAGILRRAEKRGKDLPESLRDALAAVAERVDGHPTPTG
jgi:hypothetical protein